MNIEEIGKAIQEARIKKGYSLRELAELCGVGFAHIQKIESGQKCSLDTLIKILKPLGLRIIIA